MKSLDFVHFLILWVLLNLRMLKRRSKSSSLQVCTGRSRGLDFHYLKGVSLANPVIFNFPSHVGRASKIQHFCDHVLLIFCDVKMRTRGSMDGAIDRADLEIFWKEGKRIADMFIGTIHEACSLTPMLKRTQKRNEWIFPPVKIIGILTAPGSSSPSLACPRALEIMFANIMFCIKQQGRLIFIRKVPWFWIVCFYSNECISHIVIFRSSSAWLHFISSVLFLAPSRFRGFIFQNKGVLSFLKVLVSTLARPENFTFFVSNFLISTFEMITMGAIAMIWICCHFTISEWITRSFFIERWFQTSDFFCEEKNRCFLFHISLFSIAISLYPYRWKIITHYCACEHLYKFPIHST